MTVLSSAQLARHLVRRTTATFSEFVRDCYDASGWQVARRQNGFLARHGRSGRTERVVVLGARTRFTAPSSVDADVVVARRDTPWARAVATRSDARFLGPTELHEMLLYGLDRERARAIVSDHLATRLERDSRRVGGRPAAVVAVVSLAVVVAAAVGGATLLADEPSRSTPASTSTSVTPATTTDQQQFGGRPEPNTVSTFPLGLDDDGVRNVEGVVQGHRSAVSGQSYDLLVEQRRSRSAEFDGLWDESRQVATVESRTNYNLVIREGDQSLGNETPAGYVAYADGDRVYVRSVSENGTVSYDSRRILPSEDNVFTEVTTAYVYRYLDTSQSDLSRVVYRGREVYLVTAVGTPQRIPGNVTEYRATAIVYPDGFVTELDATYTVTSGNVTEHVEVRYVYDDVGTATVAEPEWLDEVAGENSTAAETPTPVGPD